MKTLILSLTLILFSFSQEKTTALFGGLNINSLSTEGTDGATGLNIGFRYSNFQASGFSFVAAYDQKSFAVTGDFGPLGTGTLTTTVSYLTISPQFASYSQSGMYFFLGPALGVKMGTSATIEIAGQSVSTEVDDSGLSTIRLGATVGLGAIINSFMITGSYDLGLTDMIEIPDGATGDAKFSSIQLSVGILF